MKNLFKAAAFFALIAALIALLMNRKSNMHDRSKIIRVALQGELPERAPSPENISTIALYHLHFNLWDTLLAPGQKQAVARSFRVSSDNLKITFELDPEAKFSNGRSISAQDVKASFERLIQREENGHINAKGVIRTITAASPTNLTIELNAPTPSFLFLLTTPEFGIVPSESLDKEGNITNLAVTSGAYTAEKVDAKSQTVRLIRNPFFRRAEKQAPEKIDLSFLQSMNANSNLEDFDFVEVRSSDAEAIVSKAEKRNFTFKATVPSLTVFLVENTGLLSAPQAKKIASAFQERFHYESAHQFEKRSLQFFPEKTFGSLGQSEIPKVSAPKDVTLPSELLISNSRTDGPLVEAISRVFSEIGVTIRVVPLQSKEPVHYMLSSQGMNTDFPEIELHLDTVGPYADFNATDEIKRLVNKATHEPEDSKRSELIKTIGKNFLTTGKIIPLTVRSYVHLYNPDRLSLNGITTYDGDIPFFQLIRKE